MRRKVCLEILIVFLIIVFSAEPFLDAATKADQCAKKGIFVKNLTMLDLWYKKNGGDCSLWRHNHIFVIKPQDTIEIFSDLTCETLYCYKNPTYRMYKSYDADGNCRVRILTHCTLSDM